MTTATLALCIIVAVAGATEGARGELWFYAPIPIFAVGCTIATMTVEAQERHERQEKISRDD